MRKGEQTRELALREALAQSSNVGLQGITIGALATSLDMSKSGLFGHFRSKEQLQLDVLDYAGRMFVTRVFTPALDVPSGEPRLRFIVEQWLGWLGFADYALPGGCVFLTAASEFDDEPDGPVRDLLVTQQQAWLDTLARVARGGVREGHFRADTDADQVAYDILSLMLGYHFAVRLLRDERADSRTRDAFERLLDDLHTTS